MKPTLVALLALAPLGAAQSGAAGDSLGLDPRIAGPLAPRVPCGTPPPSMDVSLLPRSDCSSNNTTIRSAYDPTFTYEIQVVVHVITDAGGLLGRIPPAMVQSQIDVLNEDFLALAGTPGTLGAPGTNGMIQFALATQDPSGNPTTGITNTANSIWFYDNESYWDTLAWDPSRYLNIYTNTAGGNGTVGYVPFLPASGPVGSNADRVVCDWRSFGRNSSGAPYDLGRTVTHQVGHYLGLYDTYYGGCDGGSCSTSGDYICDTNNQLAWTNGCPSSKSSCGNSDPFDNYMDASHDICKNKFTPDQVNRMRCTLEFYRPDVWRIPGPLVPTNYCTPGTTAAGCNAQLSSTGTPSATAGGGFNVTMGQMEGKKQGLLFYGVSGANSFQWGNGSSYLCVKAPTQRMGVQSSGGTNGACDGQMSVDWNNFIATKPNAVGNPFSAGARVWIQGWFRDPPSSKSTSLSDGLEFDVLP